MQTSAEKIHEITNGVWPDRATHCQHEFDGDDHHRHLLVFRDSDHNQVATLEVKPWELVECGAVTRQEFDSYAFHQQVMLRGEDHDLRQRDERDYRANRNIQAAAGIGCIIAACFILPIVFKLIF